MLLFLSHQENCVNFRGGFCCCDLYSFLQVFKHYFEELEEESLRDNFVVVVRALVSLFFMLLAFFSNS